ncbi:MAG TPA: YceH family protein [Acidobacteriaceae bacterium]
MTLDPIQIRVLGALIEKEIATPENYPLSLNALVAACNQRSSRDPVMELTEEEVRQALHSLEDMGLTTVVRDSRVAKYEHRFRTVLNLRRDETALLCLLFLRGPQTPGELRSRADRLYSFDGLDAVESTLGRLTASVASSAGDESASAAEARPFAAVLPRQPGSRESRYMHLLGGPVEAASRDSGREKSGSRELPALHHTSGPDHDATIAARMSDLEAEIVELRAAIARIEGRLGAEQPTEYSGDATILE